MPTLKTWWLGTCVVFLSYTSWVFYTVHYSSSTQRNLAYYQEAENLNDYYFKYGQTTRVTTIRKTLASIDHYLPLYFPDGPFTRRDFIALAMVESSFDQYLTGKHKEFGIFQILPESCDWMAVKRNQYDINVNTELACFVLRKKFDKYQNYKLAIIAYNGVVRDANGKISEKYWDQFIKYRQEVDDILSRTNS